MPRTFILDTSAIYALISSSDKFHAEAIDVYLHLIDGGDDLRTTSYVLVEVSALVHRRLGFQPLKDIFDSISGVLDIYWVDRSTHEEAWRRMVDRGGAKLSFVDWSIIVAAEHIRSTIFTFDQEFARQGLSVVPFKVY